MTEPKPLKREHIIRKDDPNLYLFLDDVRSAVEWLKKETNNQLNDDRKRHEGLVSIMNIYHDRFQKLIDEAFKIK